MRTQKLDPAVKGNCQSCTACCDQPWQTLIETEKAEALNRHDFSAYPQLTGKAFFSPSDDANESRLVVAKGQGHRCVFLDADGLCIIHKELGIEAKPVMCRQFPIMPAHTWTEDRVSLNFGCPSVQSGRGESLTDQQAEVAAVVPPSPIPVKDDAGTPLSPGCMLTRAETDALFDRAVRCFESDATGDVWTCFAELLATLVMVQRHKAGTAENPTDVPLEQRLAEDAPLPGTPAIPPVTAFPSPAEAPMAARFLFAANLFPDTLAMDATARMGFFKRLTLIPRLITISRLNGTYASRLLGRNVAIHEVLAAPVAHELEPAATALLKRYYRARLWQRFPAGTRLSILAGVHQHILDLNAILFYARALAREDDSTELNESRVGRGLRHVEFHLANQGRLHEHTLKGWIRSQLHDPGLALASLRLMALCPAPAVAAESD